MTEQTEQKLTGYPSIDKPWLKYYSEEAINAVAPECTIYQNIYDNNKNHLSDTALIYFGKKITYKKMFNEIDKTAKALISYGVKADDNVAICMPATPETIYAILALNKIGANANMLNPTFSEEQLTDRINETDADVLLVVNELYDRVKCVISKTKIKTVVTCPAVNSLGAIVKAVKKAGKISGTIAWNDFIKHGKNTEVKVAAYKPERPSIMVYSSGTTGASKGIQHTNRSVNSVILQYDVEEFQFNRGEKSFAQIPIWFSTGILVTIIMPLEFGISVILEPIYDFEIFYKHIVKYKPNFMITAKSLLDYLMLKCEMNSAYKDFKYLVVGGEYVTPHSEKKINEWLRKNGNNGNLYKGYGMCECGGTVTSSTETNNKFGSSGIPMPSVTVSAFDTSTNQELKYGERGEIRVITPCRMSGYYKRPDATKDYFYTDEKGNIWACTGDMGHVDEDGNVYVDGRISDSYINEDGETIYLFDIERAILSDERVRQCKAVSSEIDGKLTHVAHTVLYTHGGSDELLLKEVQNKCCDILPENHIPKLFKLYSDALPVAPSGKLNTARMKSDNNGVITV